MTEYMWLIWLIIAIFFLCVEWVTVELISIWFTAASLVAMVLALCNLELGWQLGGFCLVSIILIIFVPSYIYVNDYYHADTKTIDAQLLNNPNELNYISNDNYFVIEPLNPKYGIIFYPGGKVEYTSYLPLMQSLANEGVVTILVRMPFNLAILNTNAADGLKDYYKHIDNWYLAGHSLGGTSAGAYLDKHHKDYKGLILLGSYITNDLSNTKLEILSIYGDKDLVLNKENYKKYKKNLPTSFKEVVINGANHAQFGVYGKQKGDGSPDITTEEQISITANEIMNFIKSN
jgi:predicted esterase